MVVDRGLDHSCSVFATDAVVSEVEAIHRFSQIINKSGCNGCEATARLSNQELRKKSVAAFG